MFPSWYISRSNVGTFLRLIASRIFAIIVAAEYLGGEIGVFTLKWPQFAVDDGCDLPPGTAQVMRWHKRLSIRSDMYQPCRKTTIFRFKNTFSLLSVV